ncbi:MAG: T9SS type A sorting domain-containing protein, partial [Bacteroidales bacterium]
LMYDAYNFENKLYKLNTGMTAWEEVVATGLPSGSRTAFTLNSSVTDHENIIVCPEGVFSGSSLDTWLAYGGGFREGIDVVSGGLMGTKLVMGTDGSGIWTIELIPTGKETVDVGGIEIYPNPATDAWTLNCGDSGFRIVRLKDLNGRIIREYVVEDSRFIIPAGDLNSSVYFLDIEEGNQYKVMKLIKQ